MRTCIHVYWCKVHRKTTQCFVSSRADYLMRSRGWYLYQIPQRAQRSYRRCLWFWAPCVFIGCLLLYPPWWDKRAELISCKTCPITKLCSVSAQKHKILPRVEETQPRMCCCPTGGWYLHKNKAWQVQRCKHNSSKRTKTKHHNAAVTGRSWESVVSD